MTSSGSPFAVNVMLKFPITTVPPSKVVSIRSLFMLCLTSKMEIEIKATVIKRRFRRLFPYQSKKVI